MGTFSLANPQYFKRPVDTYQPSEVNSDGTIVDYNVYHTQGVYLQDMISWKSWKLLVSLREEMYKGDGENDTTGDLRENVFLSRAGLVYSITPHISIYVTYNKGFDPFEASASLQVFDEPFKPITSQLYEAGFKANVFKDRLSFAAAIYQLTVHNVAVNANDISNPNLYIQQGIDRSRGIELEANGNILSGLSVSLAYAHCIAEVLDSKIASQIGTLLENSPRNSGSNWIKYTFNHGVLKDLGISAGHTRASRRNTLDADFTLPGYIVFNAGLYYRIKQLSLSAILNNVTNTVYWAGAYNNVNKWPGSTRNFMVKLGWNFGK
ncbi:MAG: TonB-dependent receptor [Bacteroidales bacterium]